MATQYVSCPSCGMTVPPSALNLDAEGNRVSDAKLYGAFVKTRHAGGYKKIRWETTSAPAHVLRGLEMQLEAALAVVRQQLADVT